MKAGILTCATPRDRARIAKRIRAVRDLFGIPENALRVEPMGAFKMRVEADDDEVFDRFFERTVP
jgi:hypothetical protein